MATRRRRGFIAWTGPVVVLGGTATADVVYVDRSAPPGGDGRSWATAFDSLQAGLALAASGDEIRVAQGVYTPAPANGPRAATFPMPSGARLLGGFVGRAGPDPDRRDPVVWVTTLSGDLNGDDQSGFLMTRDNAYHVVMLMQAKAGTTIDGVTVRAGSATGLSNAERRGAGLLIVGGAPTIAGCLISSCECGISGGGLWSQGSAAVIQDCGFVGNRCGDFGGGGAASEAGSNTLFTRCLFEQDRSVAGGGVYNSASTARYEMCRFEGCNGGALGGGAADENATVFYIRCVFASNTSPGGGGVYITNGAATTFEACLIVGNDGRGDGGGGLFVADRTHVRVINCALTGNLGSAINVQSPAGFGASTVEVINSTLASNIGDTSAPGHTIGGGLMVSGSAILTNSILWQNGGNTQEAQISGSIAGIRADYCDVQGWAGSLEGIGSFAAEPLFADFAGPDGMPGTEDDDFHLLAGSPCIDSGDTAGVPPGVLRDRDGRARFVDSPEPDAGHGPAPVVDRGCYEAHAPAVFCYSNCDLSTAPPVLNVNDFLCFQTLFAAGHPLANCDASTTPPVLSVNDFICFQAKFAAGCP